MNRYERWTARCGLTDRPRLRKIIVAVIGGTIVFFGILLIVLPGPAVIVVPLGLAVLATEFAWAGAVLKRGGDLWNKVRRRKKDAVSDDQA